MDGRFLSLAYLREGTPRQRAAAAALAKLGVFEKLAAFGPLLAGTIPLDVDLPESDLDVLCEVHDLDAFEAAAQASFGHHDGFAAHRAEHQGLPTAVVRFQAEGFAFELFGQPLAAAEQQAFLHLLAEARLLAAGTSDDREAIRTLKAEGLKTEPAFAERFALPGEPYATLRRLAVIARTATMLAFHAIDQAAPGHTLVIPRRHVETIVDLDDDLAAGLMQTAVRVARALRATLAPAGLKLMQANGRAAGQAVPHVHLHLIPRGVPKGTGGSGRAALDALAARIRAELEAPPRR
jgi:diadenosine tetraphosphate (Ap4A) HIT family hydrolase